jgi:hypothetical protein
MRSGDSSAVTGAEQAVLDEVLSSIRRVRHGAVEITIQDGRVVQINTTEKKRL